MGPLIMLYHIELFEYTLSQFCSRFTLLLELEWPSSWDSKTGVLCEKNLYQLVLLGQVVTNIYPIVSCPLPLSPCPFPYMPLAPLSHLNTFRAGSHGIPCQTERTEILCHDRLARRAR